MHPASRRCSSRTYARYARSSRLAGLASRRPEVGNLFLLGAEDAPLARRVVASPIANPNAVNSIGAVTSDVARRREMRPNRTIPVAMTAKP